MANPTKISSQREIIYLKMNNPKHKQTKDSLIAHKWKLRFKRRKPLKCSSPITTQTNLRSLKNLIKTRKSKEIRLLYPKNRKKRRRWNKRIREPPNSQINLLRNLKMWRCPSLTRPKADNKPCKRPITNLSHNYHCSTPTVASSNKVSFKIVFCNHIFLIGSS